MDSLVDAIEAADGPWPVVAIFIIGLYLMIWRYGGPMLSLMRENNALAKDAHTKAQEIATSIETNHGSKSIGDAVDKLTDSVGTLVNENRTLQVDMAAQQERLNDHITTSDERHELVMKLLSEHKDGITGGP